MSSARRVVATVAGVLALGALGPGCSGDGGGAGAGGGGAVDAGDAAAGFVDGGGVLRELDAGDLFALRDAGSDGVTLPVACEEIERATTPLPPLELGQAMLRAHGDRLLLIERPNESPTRGVTTFFRFYAATLGEPFVLLAEHEHERPIGIALEARWRDGGWDVILDLFSHEGLVAWLRLEEDGTLDVREVRGPTDRRIRVLQVASVGDDFVVLGREDDDGPPGPPWIAVLSPDGREAWMDLAAPPGGGTRWQPVPRLEGGDVLVLASRNDGRPPARLARISLDPLRVPDEGGWVDVPGPYASDDRSHPQLHDTAGGLVLTEFVGPTSGPKRLRVQWWDETLRVVASWSIETGVIGLASVVGAPPAQEIFLTLPDDDPNGLGTLFHARVAAPGVVSTPSPIGRVHMVYPPQVVPDAEGRARALHFDDRVDLERVCPVEGEMP